MTEAMGKNTCKTRPARFSPKRVLKRAKDRCGQQWDIARALHDLWSRKDKPWKEEIEPWKGLFGRKTINANSPVRQSRRYIEAWRFWRVELGIELDALLNHSPSLLGDIALTGALHTKEEAQEILDRLNADPPPTRDELLAELRKKSPHQKSKSRSGSQAWRKAKKIR